jgi:hypothetical protein
MEKMDVEKEKLQQGLSSVEIENKALARQYYYL